VQFTITEGVLIAVFGAFSSLVVFSVNKSIEAARLKTQLELRDLELKVVNEYIKPAFDQLLALVGHVDEQLKIREEMRAGFVSLGKALARSHAEGTSLVPK
jgi:hypothetical protein